MKSFAPLLLTICAAAAAQEHPPGLGDYGYRIEPPPRIILVWPLDTNRPANAYAAWRYDQARRLAYETAAAQQRLAIREQRLAIGKAAREHRDLLAQDRLERTIAKRVRIAERKARQQK